MSSFLYAEQTLVKHESLFVSSVFFRIIRSIAQAVSAILHRCRRVVFVG